MTTFKDFAPKIPTDTDEVAGFQSPGGAGDDRRFTWLNAFNYIRGKLGSAAPLDTGLGLGELPTNADIALGFQPINANLTSLSLLGLGADKISYTTGVNVYTETALTAFMRTLLDDASASAARTTLGLAIGTDVQAFNDILEDLAGLTQATDKLPYMNTPTTMATTDFTALARLLLADGTAAAMATTLGLGTGDDVEFTGIQATGRIQGAKGSDVASATDISLGLDGNAFVITGAVQIDTIIASGWTPGSVIILDFASTPTVKDATAGIGQSLSLKSSVDFVATAGDTLVLYNTGTVWKQIGGEVI